MVQSSIESDDPPTTDGTKLSPGPADPKTPSPRPNSPQPQTAPAPTSPDPTAALNHSNDPPRKHNWSRIAERTILVLTLLLGITTLTLSFRADNAARTAQATVDRSLQMQENALELAKEANNNADRQLQLAEYEACLHNSSVSLIGS
ncbi:hypothetical protein K440DRAFT_683357 [Wilcoxina mikolae CBS 423.85]|nr:hypothetical protein K440DRAFT_683357 [Wilcoxina mikolae CBS 423.85]